MKLSAAKTGQVAGTMVSALLLCACSSVSPGNARIPGTPAPDRLADRLTNWGERPRYDGKGQYFYHMSRPISHEYSLNGITIIELLVNRDGRVQKMAVVSSSGDAATDQMAMSMYWHARYSLTLTPDAPAPYVVREIVVFKDVAARVHPSMPDNSLPHTTYTEGYTTGTVAGFVK